MTERKQAVKDFLKLARKIKKRDHWFIGGFLGDVEDEWETQEKNLCPRCQTGIDNDGDGNCARCAKLSDAQVARLKGEKV